MSVKVRQGWCIVLLVVMTTGVLPRALQADVIPAESPSPDAAVLVARDLSQLARILNDPSQPQDRRDEAARRLISRQTPQARQIVTAALIDLNPGGQLAAARALIGDPRPDPAVIDPLFALIGTNRGLTEAAVRALGNYKSDPNVLTRLMVLATDRRRSGDAVRAVIVRHLGSFVEKRSARLLVEIVSDLNEVPSVRNAAGDALADLSGLTENAQDADRWQQWWQVNAQKTESQFRADLLPARAGRYDRIRYAQEQLGEELQSVLSGLYRAAPEQQRSDVLLMLLRSNDPNVRAVGARIIYLDWIDVRTVPQAAKDYLKLMVGDSDARVRTNVAETLRTLNDPEAFEPLLAQLAQETDIAAKAAIARAIAPINDLRAVPELLRLLDDPSLLVARAAADALDAMGRRIRETDPELALSVAQALRSTLERRTGGPGTTELRESLVEAMVPLARPELLGTFIQLLRDNESISTRIAALRGLGELGDPRAGDAIVRLLNDPENAIRLQAVRNLSRLQGATVYAENLRRLLDPGIERDAAVREQTWMVLQSMLPNLPKEQLQQWSDRFRDDADRRLLVLKALAEKLIAARLEDELAATNQNIGETLMRLGRPEEASTYFDIALQARKQQRAVPGAVIDMLTAQLLQSHLQARRYDRAIAFAAESIRENEQKQFIMGLEIRKEIDRLRATGEFESALSLIEAARNMRPPLAQQYLDQISELEADIRRQLSPGGASTAPLSATRPAATTRPTVTAGVE